jgi:hypothetical protein
MKGIFLRREWICALLFALSISGSPAQIAPELREDGVLYFDGNLPNKITLTFRVSTAIYSHRDFQTALAEFYTGDQVELVGMSHDGFLVKGSYRNNTVTGWIHPEDLPSGVDPALFAQAQKNQERRDAVAAAVANKTVIQGMTPEEVKQSLGIPDEISSRTDATGSTLTWVYTTYKEEPQYSYGLNAFGRSVLQTYYVKIPIGKKTIDFVNGVVTGVAEHKTDPNGPGVVNN